MDGGGGAPGELSPDLSLPLWDTSLGGGVSNLGYSDLWGPGGSPSPAPSRPTPPGQQGGLEPCQHHGQVSGDFPGRGRPAFPPSRGPQGSSAGTPVGVSC